MWAALRRRLPRDGVAGLAVNGNPDNQATAAAGREADRRGDQQVAGADTAPERGIVSRLLRLPLFYKILLANVGIALVGSALAPFLTELYSRVAGGGMMPFVAALAAVAVVVTAAVNALILWLALKPLGQLEETARRVQNGDLDARAPVSPLADRELERLTSAFNGMLDGIAGYRRRLREVAARALHAAEEERRRIALELHDETSQRLAAILLRLRVLRSAQDDHRRDTLIEELREELADILEGTRRYARGLRPPALDELGFGPAIESHARSVAETSGVEVDVRIGNGSRETLAPEAELALYRIAQEGLSNVARHAEADHAWVRIEWTDDAVVATIEDDGRGFDVADVMAAEDRGLGLFGMHERANYLGGYVEVESEPGSGTLVRATIPLRMATEGPDPTARPAAGRS